jgi:hypothetical protein
MPKPPRLRLLIPIVLGLAVPALCGAQRPRGARFPVDVDRGAFVEVSSLAMNARGDFVVTWVRQPAHDGESRMLLARRFTAGGTPAIGEIAVLDEPAPGFYSSRVAVEDDGSFVVVFSAFPDLKARRYGADGALEGESVVAGQTSGRDYEVAARPDGGFVLVWTREQLIFYRLFDRHGEPAGPERRVGPGGPPAIAVGPDGGFVVTWIATKPDPDPRYGDPFLVAQRFGAGGARIGGRILVQAPLTPADNITLPGIAADGKGNFLILWEGRIGTGPESEGFYARRFAADGTPLTGRLKLEGAVGVSPRLAMDWAGNFVVAWLQLGVGPNGRPGTFAQRFTAGGTPFRPAFRVDVNGGAEPQLASAAAGNFVVVWEGRDIFARLYRKR